MTIVSAGPRKLGWLSDIHLNFLDPSQLDVFVTHLRSHPVDAWLISGDIGEADSLIPFLDLLEERLRTKIYFVLGNHDFYGSSILETSEAVEHRVETSKHLVWLTATGPHIISDTAAVVGEDSWSDARLGDPFGTTIELTDFYVIRELNGRPRPELVRALNDLGDSAAARLAPKLEEAAGIREKLIILTHVPPFREASCFQGAPSNDEWLPWMTCQAVGTVILDCARSHPENGFLVLCGHTHGEGRCTPAPNLVVRTAGAEYGAPMVQDVFQFH